MFNSMKYFLFIIDYISKAGQYNTIDLAFSFGIRYFPIGFICTMVCLKQFKETSKLFTEKNKNRNQKKEWLKKLKISEIIYNYL